MPKIVGSNLAEHREHTRGALFVALVNSLRTESFDSLTLSKIAKRAGVGRTAVYNHFSDKEDLLLEFISAASNEFARALMQALERVSDPLDGIRLYLRAQMQLKDQYHLHDGINLGSVRRSRRPGDFHRHAGMVEHILERLLQAAIKAGKLPAGSLGTSINLLHACLASQSLAGDQAQREQQMSQVEQFILRGLGARPADLAHLSDLSRVKFDFGQHLGDQIKYPVEAQKHGSDARDRESASPRASGALAGARCPVMSHRS